MIPMEQPTGEGHSVLASRSERRSVGRQSTHLFCSKWPLRITLSPWKGRDGQVFVAAVQSNSTTMTEAGATVADSSELQQMDEGRRTGGGVGGVSFFTIVSRIKAGRGLCYRRYVRAVSSAASSASSGVLPRGQ
jgi:hypothetical protein